MMYNELFVKSAVKGGPLAEEEVLKYGLMVHPTQEMQKMIQT